MRAAGGWILVQRPVRPVRVVVIDVLAQDLPQVPFADDQHPVGLAAGGARRTARRSRCPTSSTTPDPHDRYRRVRVTHPFHPLYGQDFEFVAHRQNWGEDRVHLHDENGQLFSLPAGWTDVAAADPFVVIADGRCPFTTGGLLSLADLIDRLRSQPDSDEAVKRITP